ncbi:MAG: DUF4037 domain-containing protein [candidate division WOR-3 bacterium]|nr:MAG: DUF4037 domain-containing protein [candidate division WOR-3 bacterium]
MKGIGLSESLFSEVVRPLLQRLFPELLDNISAAILGDGSEVLGYDDEISRDHNFSPRVVLFFEDETFDRVGSAVAEQLKSGLPGRHAGVELLEHGGRSALQVLPLPRHFLEYLGVAAMPATPLDWLKYDEQRLLELTAGRVFHDPSGRLAELRQRFGFFPEQVRLYLLRLAFVRMSECAGAERAVRRKDLVALRLYAGHFSYFAIKAAHLLERRYCPYHKWMARSLQGLGETGRKMHELVAALLSAATPEAARTGFLDVLELLGARVTDELGVSRPGPHDPEGGVFLGFDWSAVTGPLKDRLPEELKDLSPVISPPRFLGFVFDYTGYDARYEDMLAANLGFLRE